VPGGRREGFRVGPSEADAFRVEVLVVEPVDAVDDFGWCDGGGVVVGEGIEGGEGGEAVSGAALEYWGYGGAGGFVVCLDHDRLLGDPDYSAA